MIKGPPTTSIPPSTFNDAETRQLIPKNDNFKTICYASFLDTVNHMRGRSETKLSPVKPR